MVTDLVRFQTILEKAKADNLPEEVINHIMQLRKEVLAEKEKKKRQPRAPAPSGGISISDASRKYCIPNQTISRWAQKGYVNIISRDNWIVYLSEERISQLAVAYKRDPGNGSWAVKNFIAREKQS